MRLRNALGEPLRPRETIPNTDGYKLWAYDKHGDRREAVVVRDLPTGVHRLSGATLGNVVGWMPRK